MMEVLQTHEQCPEDLLAADSLTDFSLYPYSLHNHQNRKISAKVAKNVTEIVKNMKEKIESIITIIEK